MPYKVEVYAEARAQIRGLPAEALPAMAEAVTMLELAPWSGSPLTPDTADAAVRVLPFGPHRTGMLTYLILDEQLRVDILQVLWAG